MKGGVKIEGLDALRKFMTDASTEIREQAMPIVVDETEQAARDIAAALPSRTGTLRSRVRTSYPARGAVLAGVVTSAAPHSHLVEFGTKQRQTASGANRGRMPALSPAVTPRIATVRRSRMLRRIADVLRGLGFEVTGV
jgi:hypothetical protein